MAILYKISLRGKTPLHRPRNIVSRAAKPRFSGQPNMRTKFYIPLTKFYTLAIPYFWRVGKEGVSLRRDKDGRERAGAHRCPDAFLEMMNKLIRKKRVCRNLVLARRWRGGRRFAQTYLIINHKNNLRSSAQSASSACFSAIWHTLP